MVIVRILRTVLCASGVLLGVTACDFSTSQEIGCAVAEEAEAEIDWDKTDARMLTEDDLYGFSFQQLEEVASDARSYFVIAATDLTGEFEGETDKSAHYFWV